MPKRMMPDPRARAAAPATFPQRVLVIADLGMSYNSSTTMQHVYVRPRMGVLVQTGAAPASLLALRGHATPLADQHI